MYHSLHLLCLLENTDTSLAFASSRLDNKALMGNSKRWAIEPNGLNGYWFALSCE